MNNLFNESFGGSMRVAVIGVLGILALFLLAETINTATGFGRSGAPATDTITVQGEGQATVAPDVARVTFSVDHIAKTVSEAQAATTKQANAVLAYVKAQGISEKDVKTLSYNVSPQYSYPNPCSPLDLCPINYSNTPKVTGYQVSQSVQITMRDLTKVGEMLGGFGSLEVQNLNGPNFALDDSTEGYNAARADAINKARTQAKILAKQLGVHLGKIVTFSESSGGRAYPVMYAKESMVADMGGAPAPEIPAGENTYSASVSITYEIR